MVQWQKTPSLGPTSETNRTVPQRHPPVTGMWGFAIGASYDGTAVKAPVDCTASTRGEREPAGGGRGATAVANAVALYVERDGITFTAVHLDGARRVAETARRQGARLLHLSRIATPTRPRPTSAPAGAGRTPCVPPATAPLSSVPA